MTNAEQRAVEKLYHYLSLAGVMVDQHELLNLVRDLAEVARESANGR